MEYFIVDKEWVESLPKVTNYKHATSRYYAPDGIFSEQIFGPVKDYTCWCRAYTAEYIDSIYHMLLNKTCMHYIHDIDKPEWTSLEIIENKKPILYYDTKNDEIRCYKCNIPIVSSLERAKRFARIELVTPILNPLLELIIPQIKSVVKGSKIATIENGQLLFKDNNYDLQDHVEVAEIIHQVYGYPMDIILLTNILVFPPAYRQPYEWNIGEINRLFNQIIGANQELPFFTHQQQRAIYNNVNALYKWLYNRVGADKEKGVRSYILGRELSHSARSAILPDPTLDVTTISIPQDLKKYWQDIGEKDRIILNRQPTLHRRGMLCTFTKFNEDEEDRVIYLNPFIYEGLNADNDGDSIVSDIILYYNDKAIKINIKDLQNLKLSDLKEVD